MDKYTVMPPDNGMLLVLKENELTSHEKTRLSEGSQSEKAIAVCHAGILKERNSGDGESLSDDQELTEGRGEQAEHGACLRP